MNFDIVFVTYNSKKWVEKCFNSIKNLDYTLKNISIIIVDNASTDDTLEALKNIKNSYSDIFKDFIILESNINLGFGKGNNYGASYCISDYIFFLNIDTELDKHALKNIEYYINISNSDTVLWELRQFPYEHPKMYNALTLETSWSSGAAFVIKKDIFLKIDGFDKNIFMYAEDVDLSWRLRMQGYKIKYMPKAVVYHYTYQGVDEIKPNQYINSIANNILLRFKFGNLWSIFAGFVFLLKVFVSKNVFKNSKIRLFGRLMKNILILPKVFWWRIKNFKTIKNFKAKFYGWDYELTREGAFYFNEFPKTNPLVSIIVRTCGRPSILRETLISLRNQTYSNIEIVIVEDGGNTSENLIKDEFSDLNIKYFYVNGDVGRSKVGNMAMEAAQGKYLNFLDDDDLYYADHIEVLVRQLEINTSYKLAYSLAFETPIIIKSKDPYIYQEKRFNLAYKQKFSRILLFHHNYIPIQCIMFEKSIFQDLGGLDEKLDFLEDWDLWVRYALNNNFYYINKVTSIYRFPADKKIQVDRQKKFAEALKEVREKHKSYLSTVSAYEVASEFQEIMDSYVFMVSKDSFRKIQNKSWILSKIIIKAYTITRKTLGKL